MADSEKMVSRSRLELAKAYFGGLSHTHTVLSNHLGHRESNLSVDKIVQTLSDAGLVKNEDAPLQFILFNEHPSDPAHPRRLGRFSRRANRLIHQRRRPVVGTVTLLYGLEVSILPDGTTDLVPRLSDNSSLVIASRHKLPKRIERDPTSIRELFRAALQNPAIDVIGHPARYIENIAELDWPDFFAEAAASGTAIEINFNAFPEYWDFQDRIDFWEKWLRDLAQSNAPIFIGSDIHNRRQLRRFCAEWGALSQPGSVPKNNILARFVMALDEAGIDPAQVINAEKDSFFEWLALDKASRAKLCLDNRKG